MKSNIVFLLIDSLRADKFFGNHKTSITPNFNRLIESGVYFNQAISSSDATLINWASIFTGNNAFKTGIRSTRFNKLNKDQITLFSKLKSKNYNFYGYLPKLGEIMGLFPEFENKDAYFGNLSLETGLGKKIINKINSNLMKPPWFFYIHLEELHFPISVPEEFNSKKFGIGSYERQISFIDSWIGKIIDKINLNDTLVVITSDHGCYVPSTVVNDLVINLEEKPKLQKIATKTHKNLPDFLHPLKQKVFLILEKFHKSRKNKILKNLDLEPYQKRNLNWQRSDLDKFLYDENIHIPLLFLGNGIKNSKNIPDLVRNVDISPTLIDLIFDETDLTVDGQSLKPLIEGKILNELPAFIESTPFVHLTSNDVIGIRTSKFKYFRDKNDAMKRVYLFDLEKDPHENNNIASTNQETISDMELKIKQILNYTKTSNTEENDNESKLIEEELKKLGYM